MNVATAHTMAQSTFKPMKLYEPNDHTASILRDVVAKENGNTNPAYPEIRPSTWHNVNKQIPTTPYIYTPGFDKQISCRSTSATDITVHITSYLIVNVLPENI